MYFPSKKNIMYLFIGLKGIFVLSKINAFLSLLSYLL
jgi:hypothetical protein